MAQPSPDSLEIRSSNQRYAIKEALYLYTSIIAAGGDNTRMMLNTFLGDELDQFDPSRWLDGKEGISSMSCGLLEVDGQFLLVTGLRRKRCTLRRRGSNSVLTSHQQDLVYACDIGD